MSDMNEPPMPDDNRRTGWAELGLGGTVQLANPGLRLGARVLDVIIGGILGVIVFFVVAAASFDNGTSGFSTGTTVVTLILGLLVGIAYEVWPTALWGQTLGKRIVGIKVVHAMTGEAPGWGKAMGRWAVPALPSVIPFVQFIGWIFTLLCYVSLTWDRVHQGWHDKAAGTLVIRLR
ncbi:RDD family protein [Candidatus Poriferisodalis sp.]|uniref:RDD family protein n=1 Tax=Candidatus Poriferisodalis sp. TaxID=3101277 RepID=UPI003D0AA5EF